MKKLSILFLLLFGTVLYAKINIVVSILPQKNFVKEIAGDKADITVMVKPGNSPHTYEPKPSQMRYISKADIYFKIGVEFEKVWIKKFVNQNRKMKVVDLSKRITRYGKDPHIWTSPKNVKIIAENIKEALCEFDTENCEYYTKNYEKFISKISRLQNEIKEILKNVKEGSRFMVFHPSWGYFAKEFHLIQFPVEIEGKSPKPKTLVKIIKTARKENIKVILTSPEFSQKSAKVIAKELGIKVVKITPLAQNWYDNLIYLAKVIASKESK